MKNLVSQHTNARFLNDHEATEGYYFRESIEFANRVNYRPRKKEVFDKQSIKAIKAMKREANKNFKNERIIHYHAV